MRAVRLNGNSKIVDQKKQNKLIMILCVFVTIKYIVHNKWCSFKSLFM